MAPAGVPDSTAWEQSVSECAVLPLVPMLPRVSVLTAHCTRVPRNTRGGDGRSCSTLGLRHTAPCYTPRPSSPAHSFSIGKSSFSRLRERACRDGQVQGSHLPTAPCVSPPWATPWQGHATGWQPTAHALPFPVRWDRVVSADAEGTDLRGDHRKRQHELAFSTSFSAASILPGTGSHPPSPCGSVGRCHGGFFPIFPSSKRVGDSAPNDWLSFTGRGKTGTSLLW